MFRHKVDVSTEFSLEKYEDAPDSREIEVAQVHPVPRDNPPTEIVSREPYWPDEALVESVNLAIALGRPLLLQGDPGCGKTRLAYAIAYTLGLPLEEGYIKSTSRAQELIYMYDALNRLYDAQLGEAGDRGEDGQPLSRDVRNYIKLGPLGRAIARAQYGRRSVVLIDEIDKADLDFPNDLLWELDRLEFSIPEAPQIRYAVGDNPQLRPIVIITHNEEKALPTAFLRRCIFHYLEFPNSESQLLRIMNLHHQGNEELSKRAIGVLLRLRGSKLDLSKKPGLSELLDWVGYLSAVKAPLEELGRLPYLGALLKQQRDQQQAVKEFTDT